MGKLNQRKNRKKTHRKRGSRVRRASVQKGGAFNNLVVFAHGMFNNVDIQQPIIQIPPGINLYYRGGLGTICMVPSHSELYNGKISKYCENSQGDPFNIASYMTPTSSIIAPGHSTGLPVRLYQTGSFFPNMLLQFDGTVGLEYLCDSAQFGIDGSVSATGPIRLMEYFSHKLSQFPSGVNIQLICCGEDIPAYVLAQVEQMNNPFSPTPPPSPQNPWGSSVGGKHGDYNMN